MILMGLSRLPEIAASLLFHGRGSETPVAVIAQGSLPAERTLVGTLDTIAGDVARAGLRAPATIVVGEVVRVRQRLLVGAQRSTILRSQSSKTVRRSSASSA